MKHTLTTQHVGLFSRTVTIARGKARPLVSCLYRTGQMRRFTRPICKCLRTDSFTYAADYGSTRVLARGMLTYSIRF